MLSCGRTQWKDVVGDLMSNRRIKLCRDREDENVDQENVLSGLILIL